MKNKFQFYELVKIIDADPALKDIQGCTGIVKGMSQDEVTGKWGYAILIPEKEAVWDIEEDQLISLGKKANPEDYKPVDTIKVRVNPKTGEGEIVEDEED